MVNINTVYERVQNLANKFQVGAYLNPTEFNNYANMANIGLLSIDYEQYNQTQKMTDRMKDFIVSRQMMIDGYGKADYPTNYIYFVSLKTYKREEYLALRRSCDGRQPTQKEYAALPQIPIKLTDNDKINNLYYSEIYSPDYVAPRATMYGDYIQFYPTNLGVCVLDYFKKPVTVVWGYTDDIYGLPVYNPTTSVNFEWSENVANALVMEICKYAGVEIRDIDLAKAATELESTGQ